MYECPNCAGNLKFHIGKQMLHCEMCNTEMDPYAFSKEKDAEENEFFEVTVFTCPQCGGELLSDDTTAATFCSYCGASTILDSHLSKTKRPKRIIPFQKTKEECEEAYSKAVGAAFFAPKELRGGGVIEKFRAIYMPYWVYSFENKEEIKFIGTQTVKEGEHTKTNVIHLKCNVDAEYSGIAFDASSAFSDQLSMAIAPYDINKAKPFTPSFLSGFYADINDVEAIAYYDSAKEIMVEHAYNEMVKDSSFFGYELHQPRGRSSLCLALRPRKVEEELALLPVWFLSYRKDDRVAYGVVNGQTGKVAVDLPIDMRRFFTGSLLLSIPIILFLNLFCQVAPAAMLVITALLASICAVFAHIQTTHIMLKESYEDRLLEGVEKKQAKGRRRLISELISMVLLMGFSFFEVAFMIVSSFPKVGLRFMGIIGLVYLAYLGIDIYQKRIVRDMTNTNLVIYEEMWQKKLQTMIKPVVAILIASLLLLWCPASTMFYYLGAVLCMVVIVLVIVDVIKGHNILTTKPLKQFEKRGGDM